MGKYYQKAFEEILKEQKILQCKWHRFSRKHQYIQSVSLLYRNIAIRRNQLQTGEMALCLRILADFAEEPRLGSQHPHGSLELSLAPIPRGPARLSSL